MDESLPFGLLVDIVPVQTEMPVEQLVSDCVTVLCGAEQVMNCSFIQKSPELNQ